MLSEAVAVVPDERPGPAELNFLEKRYVRPLAGRTAHARTPNHVAVDCTHSADLEARLAQALLLMRSERQPEPVLMREVLGPILDPTQGPHIPTAMYQRLKSWGGI